MLPLSIIRNRVRSLFTIDKYLLAKVANELAKVVYSEHNLSERSIEGMILAVQRHTRTGYDKAIRAVGAHYYDGSHKDIQQETNDALRAKLSLLRVK